MKKIEIMEKKSPETEDNSAPDTCGGVKRPSDAPVGSVGPGAWDCQGTSWIWIPAA